MIIEGTAGDYEVLIVDDHMYIRLISHDLVLVDSQFPSLMALSSTLRCTLGYRDAVELLSAHDVPKNSPLWHLNHDNPFR